MKEQDFNCSITANVTAREATEAISHVSDWWVTNFEGTSAKLDDVFTARVGETFVTFSITEFIPDTKIVWTVINCYLPWLKDKTEWMNTKLIFEICAENNLTTINFTHLGLVPQLECYDNCAKGWAVYVQGSLLKLMNEGIGQPT